MMTAFRSGLDLVAAALRWLRERRMVFTRRKNIYDEIDLTTVDFSPKDNQRVIQNLMRAISRGHRNDERSSDS